MIEPSSDERRMRLGRHEQREQCRSRFEELGWRARSAAAAGEHAEGELQQRRLWLQLRVAGSASRRTYCAEMEPEVTTYSALLEGHEPSGVP